MLAGYSKGKRTLRSWDGSTPQQGIWQQAADIQLLKWAMRRDDQCLINIAEACKGLEGFT